jgi:MarR family transcriptional regulator, lower aerobic nicotinate degradation pathway regulator
MQQAAPQPPEAANDAHPHSAAAAAAAAYDLSDLLEQVANRMRSGLDASLAAMDIDARHYRVARLVQSLGPQSQVALCDHTAVDRASMVKLVDHLQANGWVTREPFPADRRQNAVTLTARGRKGLKAAELASRRNEEHLASALTASQVLLLKQLLGQLRAG